MARTKKQIQKKVQKELVKEIKKTSPKLIAVILIFFVLGVASGAFANYFICKNDKFVVLGEKEITLTVGDTYLEEGAKAISFGKDVSSAITVESDIDTLTPGEYEVVYKCSNFKYKDIIRVRKVIVVEVGAWKLQAK